MKPQTPTVSQRPAPDVTQVRRAFERYRRLAERWSPPAATPGRRPKPPPALR